MSSIICGGLDELCHCLALAGRETRSDSHLGAGETSGHPLEFGGIGKRHGKGQSSQGRRERQHRRHYFNIACRAPSGAGRGRVPMAGLYWWPGTVSHPALARGGRHSAIESQETKCFRCAVMATAVAMASMSGVVTRAAPGPSSMTESVTRLERELTTRYGAGQAERIRRGLRQSASFWRQSDGAPAAFEAFVRRNFAGDQAALDQVFSRYEKLLEQIDGHMLEITLGAAHANGPGHRARASLRRGFCRLRPLGARHRRPVRQQTGFRGSAQLPAYHPRGAPGAGAELGPAASGPKPGWRSGSPGACPPE